MLTAKQMAELIAGRKEEPLKTEEVIKPQLTEEQREALVSSLRESREGWDSYNFTRRK